MLGPEVEDEVFECEGDGGCDEGGRQDEEEYLEDEGKVDEGIEGHDQASSVADELEGGPNCEVCCV